MADHRVTDLSFGHLGRTTYTSDTTRWDFSVDTQHELHFQQIQEFKACGLLSLTNEAEEKLTSSVTVTSQMRWLSKFYPETYPGLNTISTLVKTQSLIETAVHEGSLITTAHAKDTYKISGSRRPTILAFSSGASGHVLHLIKPGSETRSWSNYREARLKLLDPSHLEHGYWTGTGGGIRQIVSADSEEIKTGPWLAVRQDTTVTIFEPVYGKMLEPMVSLLDRTETVSTSMLNPNPVVSLSVERTSSKVHVDFTFNPFYPRQFAVIGESGCWSIWNVESLHNKGSTRFLTPGRSGEHSESQIQDGSSSTGKYYLEHADGWHKILWVCDVDTIMVCSRRHLAVVSLKLSPGRLISANFLPTKGFDWILDAARSLISPDHLFILTTSRIYWIKIFLAEDGTKSIRVLLSYRHFRDESDETMRLTALDDANVSVAISSSKSPVTNFYTFRVDLSSSISCQASLVPRPSLQDSHAMLFRSICFLPCAYEPGESEFGPDGMSLIRSDPSFYQLWGLTSAFDLLTTLCVSQRQVTGGKLNQWIQPPDKRVRLPVRRKGPKIVVEDDFIVPDGSLEDEKNTGMEKAPRLIFKDDIRYRLDWSVVFRRAFAPSPLSDVPERFQSMSDILGSITDCIATALLEGVLPMKTLAGIAGFSRSSGELEEVALSLGNFQTASIPDTQNPEATSIFKLSGLAACPRMTDIVGSDTVCVDLVRIHEQLVEYWVSSLPITVPNPTRLAKFKAIRQLGVELSLNSLGVSVQDRTCTATGPVVRPENDEEQNDITSREVSPGLLSSQAYAAPGNEIYSSLLTPSRTPSLYSHTNSAASEMKEDPAISRLRHYTLSVKARPDLGKSTLLAHWPSQPGVDPTTYSYGAVQKAAAEESGNESEYMNHKEEARRRRRTERFLRQERTRLRGPISQDFAIIQSGSQPEAHLGRSSQVGNELPMTQPDRGTFGSRTVTTKAKKPKKQRKAGF